MTTYPRRLLSVSMLLLAACSLATTGCARSLFRDSPRARNNIEKYYDGDSATAATEARRRGGETGFGFPTGPN